VRLDAARLAPPGASVEPRPAAPVARLGIGLDCLDRWTMRSATASTNSSRTASASEGSGSGSGGAKIELRYCLCACFETAPSTNMRVGSLNGS
jgi:hypothetical protein